jgi:ribosomal protein L7Ae-like RNA K-turn-binding protein
MKVSKVNGKEAALIGFAIKARQSVLGFEAVRRTAQKGKLALVLLHPQLSQNSVQKLKHLLNEHNVPFYTTDPEGDWDNWWGLNRHRILGIKKGSIARSIFENFKSGE